MPDSIGVTPLQVLLLDKVIPKSEAMQVTGCGRMTVWRWAKGTSEPRPETARLLVERYGAQTGLTLDGCYIKSVTLTPAQAAAYGLGAGEK